jgi:hypothetical protein
MLELTLFGLQGSRKRGNKLSDSIGPEKDQPTDEQQQPADTLPLAKPDNTKDQAHNTATGSQSTDQQERPKPETTSAFRRWQTSQKVFVVGELTLAAAIAYFAWVQADVSEGQRKAMIEQNTIVQGQLDAMAEQNKAILEQTKLAKGQLEQAQRATKQTDETLEIMRLGQRAWIAVDVPIELEFPAGIPIFTRILVTNYGETPAIITGTNTKVVPLKKGDSLSTHVKKPEEMVTARNTMCAPGQSLTFPEHHMVPTVDQVSAIREGDELTLWVIFSAIYDDAFGETHAYQQCMFYDTATEKASFAPDCQD